MTTLKAWLGAVALVAAASFPAAADPVEPGVPFVVRLHRASLSSERAPIGPVLFGSLAFAQDAEGVELRAMLADQSLQVKAAQGESPDVVQLTITPAD
jgi:hypothetical protein